MNAALQFVGGDEVVESFLLTDDSGGIQDITNLTITGGVWWREKERISLTTLSEGGIVVLANAPAPATSGEDQEPHGFFTLTEEQTDRIPLGQVASMRLTAVTTDDVKLSSFFALLERIA